MCWERFTCVSEIWPLTASIQATPWRAHSGLDEGGVSFFAIEKKENESVVCPKGLDPIRCMLSIVLPLLSLGELFLLEVESLLAKDISGNSYVDFEEEIATHRHIP